MLLDLYTYIAADGALGKKVKNVARNISENALYLIERKRGFNKNCVSDRSYENDVNLKKVEKVLKHELRRCEVETMDKIVKDLEDVARRYESKILY